MRKRTDEREETKTKKNETTLPWNIHTLALEHPHSCLGTSTWAMSWYTLAATPVLRRWIEGCPYKGVELNDGNKKPTVPTVGYPPPPPPGR